MIAGRSYRGLMKETAGLRREEYTFSTAKIVKHDDKGEISCGGARVIIIRIERPTTWGEEDNK